MYISYANLNQLVVIVVLVSYFLKVNKLQYFNWNCLFIYLFAIGKISSAYVILSNL